MKSHGRSESEYKQPVFKEELPSIISQETYSTYSIHPWSIWCCLFIGVFLILVFKGGFLLAGLYSALIGLYVLARRMTFSTRIFASKQVVRVKALGKTIEMAAPLRGNLVWKYRSRMGVNGLSNDIYVFLQLRDADDKSYTFYEGIVLDARFPHEAKYVTHEITIPDHAIRVLRVDKLARYLSSVLLDGGIIYEDGM